ncbi:MAG: outer membrane beta-barrel protein [Bacteroidetes bacterium]|nr:outer membrane beta-barrel protein [Bacteroidota bacterium]
MKNFFFILAALLTLNCASAQNSDEIGFFIGGGYYIGELNPTTHLGSLTRPAAGIVYRHNFNYRFAVAGDLIFGSVQGIDSRSTSYEQQKRNLSFRSPITEFGGRAEFNFIEYKIGDDKYPFTPFMFLGLAVFNFNPRASYGNQWVNLQPLKTEGQSKAYLRTQLSIPFGVGFRANLAQRVGLVAEWGMRKTFTDYLDDVSTTYADPSVLLANGGPLAVAVADRSTTPNDVGRERGNPRNKDWYSFVGLTITFQLAGKPHKCSSYNY